MNSLYYYKFLLLDTKNTLIEEFHLMSFHMYDLLVRPTVNLRSICLGVNILIPSAYVNYNGNIPLLKALRVDSRP